MKFYQKLILFYLFVAFMGFLLRHAIDYASGGGKYEDKNKPTHFEQQLNLQKKIHENSQKK